VNDSLKGSQRPTLLCEPPDAVDWTLSDIAVDFAESVGYDLYDWQKWIVRWAFARRADGLWAARDFGLEVARQNGKNICLEVIELAAVFHFGENLVIHSAHRADVSHEHFLSLRSRIENAEDLIAAMPVASPNRGFITTNGNESIKLANGARILFKARAKASGRGPRPQRIVFDEALVLDFDAVGSMAPGLSAQRNPQIIFASSPPKTDSTMMHSLRRRAFESRDADRLFYAAWNNPPDIDHDDRQAWAAVNPSLGLGALSMESLEQNRMLLIDSPEEFAREHLGVAETPDGSTGLIALDEWLSLCSATVEAGLDAVLAVDASPDRQTASVAVVDSDGSCELLRTEPGVSWAYDFTKERALRNNARVAVDLTGPLAGWVPQFHNDGVEVIGLSGSDVSSGCAEFLDAIASGSIRVRQSGALEVAVTTARMSTTGDRRRFVRSKSSSDISPLMALVLALWVARSMPISGDFFIY
jgi:phage terminase large subunit-like protein